MKIPMIYPGKPILHEGSSVYQCLLTAEQIRILEAAPALLEACKGAKLVLHSVLRDYLDEPWAQAIEQAIAQAEGKE